MAEKNLKIDKNFSLYGFEFDNSDWPTEVSLILEVPYSVEEYEADIDKEKAIEIIKFLKERFKI
jgi:hypothetical protein